MKTEIGHNLSRAAVSIETSASFSLAATNTLSKAANDLVSLAYANQQQAADELRIAMQDVAEMEISDEQVTGYAAANNITVTTAMLDINNKVVSDTAINYQSIRDVMRTSRSKAMINAVRRALVGDCWVLEIGKQREIADKTIVFREKSDAEIQIEQQAEKAKEQLKAAKDQLKEQEKLAKAAQKVAVTVDQLADMIGSQLSELKHEPFEKLLALVLSEQARRLNSPTDKQRHVIDVSKTRVPVNPAMADKLAEIKKARANA